MDNTNTALLTNISGTQLAKVEGVVVHSLMLEDFQPDQSHTADQIGTVWSEMKDSGAHLAIDLVSFVKYAEDTTAINHTRTGLAQSYISNALYKGDPNAKTIGFAVAFPTGQDYALIERRAVIAIGDYLKQKQLSTENLWREYDLTRDPSPAQYLDNTKWEAFVAAIGAYMTASAAEGFDIGTYEIENAWASDAELRTYLALNAVENAKGSVIDDRGIPAAKIVSDVTATNVKLATTNHNTDIIYSSTEQASAGEGTKAYNTLDAKFATKVFHVDPIYPDTIVPPGTSTNPFNASDDARAQAIEQSTIPSIEEYERAQKTFDYEKHKGIKKVSRGKPVNNNDPYPVDMKISQLERHHPKVKIDDVLLTINDANGIGCNAGLSLMKNMLMLSDAITDQSKRVESRLVLLENISSVLLRYLFRLAARTPINCVYYGGQDVFGKYKSIRCLHDDRVHDGQSMTMDQCLNCSRYEPIIGQIYDILDDSGINLSQILDESQMSYSDMAKYAELNEISQIHTEKEEFAFSDTIAINTKLQAEVRRLEEKNQQLEQELYAKAAASKEATE
jgi:hypothetical protein